MPTTRAPPDPFTAHAPRRPTSRTTHIVEEDSIAHTLRLTTHSLRSTASSAPSRNLFAPTLSRRPTTSTNASTVHEDNSSGDENEHQLVGVRITRRGPQTRRRAVRERGRSVVEEEEEEEEDDKAALAGREGNYVVQVPGLEEWEPDAVEKAQREAREEDARLTSITREFWAKGAALGGRGSRQIDEEELTQPSMDAMARLRETVIEKLGEEEWMYEPTDYMQSLLVRNHGRL
ncbi:hypothetical protein H2203_002397 [Taxawa tesnikishii (nom. ined.)]|nr:hypothetical protein H2203_002397 [Dothideales sp. JES 119]